MSARTLLFALLLLITTAAAQAEPPVSKSAAGWLTLPSPTAWLPSLPGTSKSSAQNPPLITRATVGAWRSVSNSVSRSWRWTSTTLNPWSNSTGQKSKSESPGFWQQLFTAQPEREVDTITDFLAQPKPY